MQLELLAEAVTWVTLTLQGKVTMSKKQLDEQHNKLDRVSKQLVRYARDIRSAKGKKTQTTEEVSGFTNCYEFSPDTKSTI